MGSKQWSSIYYFGERKSILPKSIHVSATKFEPDPAPLQWVSIKYLRKPISLDLEAKTEIYAFARPLNDLSIHTVNIHTYLIFVNFGLFLYFDRAVDSFRSTFHFIGWFRPKDVVVPMRAIPRVLAGCILAASLLIYVVIFGSPLQPQGKFACDHLAHSLGPMCFRPKILDSMNCQFRSSHQSWHTSPATSI